MEKIIAIFLVIVGVIGIAFLTGCVGGFFVWLLYPVAVPAVFPGLVKLVFWHQS